MESRRSAVIQLYRAGNSKSKIVSLLKTMFVYRTLNRYNDTGDITDKLRPGRPRFIRIFSLTRNVSQRIRRKSTQKWFKEKFPAFISSTEWPPCSPDLNPLDYSIWSILEDRVCSKRYASAHDLKVALTREWQKIPEDHVRASVDAFITRLKACVKARCDIFE